MQKKDSEKREIVSLIEGEVNNISRLLGEMVECDDNTKIYRRAKGSILHDFYNGCERIFEIIARRIDGGLPAAEHWHRKLLQQMTIPIKDIRLPVISRGLAANLDEYLAFRHLFRNIYGFELDSGKLDRLAIDFDKAAKHFQQEIVDFISKL